MKFFATAAKGLEEVLQEELQALGMRAVEPGNGGVAFSGSPRDGYRACLWLRTANRVLLPLKEFYCPSEDALYEGVNGIDWPEHLTPEMTLAVDANVRDSAISHSRFAALKTKDAIVDKLRDACGRRPSVDTRNPDLRINLHIARNRCTLSLDLSGAGLHRRGYRRDPTIAPLKETLAAGLVALTGWDGSSHFVDPMCGSGSLPLEAALMASKTAPGVLSHDFGFQRWRDFDQETWTAVLEEARNARCDMLGNLIYGSDKDRRVVELARRNAEASGIGDKIRWSQRDFFLLDPPATSGTLLCNPPYGARIGDERGLETFYKNIGDTLKQNWKGWTAWVFTGNLAMAKRIGLKPSRRIVLYNGPIECRLLKFDLY